MRYKMNDVRIGKTDEGSNSSDTAERRVDQSC